MALVGWRCRLRVASELATRAVAKARRCISVEHPHAGLVRCRAAWLRCGLVPVLDQRLVVSVAGVCPLSLFLLARNERQTLVLC